MPVFFLNGLSKRVDDVALVALRLLVVVPDGLAVDGERLLVQQALLSQFAQHHRQAAGIVEILHQVLARGHQVEHGVHAAAETVPVRRGRA